MAETSSSTFTSWLPTVIAEAMHGYNEAGPTVNFVPNYPMSGGTLYLPEYGTLTATAMSEGSPYSAPVTWTPTGATLTSAKYGIEVLLTDEAIDRAMKQNNFDLVREASYAEGQALGTKLNTLLCALFSGFANGAGSGSSTTSSVTTLSFALSTLKNNKAKGPFAGFYNPLSAHYLMVNAKYTAPAGPDQLSQPGSEWLAGNVLGIPIYADPNIAVASSASYNAVINKDALAVGIEKQGDPEIERVRGVGYVIHWNWRVAVIERKDLGGYYLYEKAA